MKLFNAKLLVKAIFFILFFIMIIYPLSINNHPFYLDNLKPIISYNESKKEILLKGRNYLDKCLNFTNILEYKYISKPKISVIIPMFNCEKTIKSSLNSVQYQNISSIEIILINDFSTDNTSKIVEKIIKKDQRIKIINNHKNMGTLYSRSIAALIAKGKYIFGLDNDDLYFDEDLLDYIYKRGIKENLDIIEFLTINAWDYNIEISNMKDIYTYQYQDNLYIQQPELSTWMIKFNGNFIVHNNMIWDKCIKTSVYQKSVNLLGIKRYSQFVSWSEDTSMNFVIFNIANDFKYIHKYGIFHFRGHSTASFRQSIDSKIFGEIFFFNIIYDFSKNDTFNKNFIFEQALYIKKTYNISKNNKGNVTNYMYLTFVLNKLVNNKYLIKKNMRKLKKLFMN